MTLPIRYSGNSVWVSNNSFEERVVIPNEVRDAQAEHGADAKRMQ